MFGRFARKCEIQTILSISSKVKSNPTRDACVAKENGTLGLLSSNLWSIYQKGKTGPISNESKQIAKTIAVFDVIQSFAMLRLSVMHVGKQRILSRIWGEYNDIVEGKREAKRTKSSKDNKKEYDDGFEDNVDMDRGFLSRMLEKFNKSSHIWSDIKEEFSQRANNLSENIGFVRKRKHFGLKRKNKGGKSNKCLNKQTTIQDILTKKLNRDSRFSKYKPPKKKRKQTIIHNQPPGEVRFSNNNEEHMLADIDKSIKRISKIHISEEVSPSRGFSGCKFSFDDILQDIETLVSSEIINTDIKMEVSSLRNEILTMDVESGRINTNRLSGDERFEAMLFALDVFEWSREDTQIEIHDEMLLVLLPVIYGDEWNTNYEHIMTRYDVSKYQPELLIICARRWGKTVGCAMMSSTLILFVPSLTSIVFSTGQIASTRFMHESVKLMLQSPFMSSCKILKNGEQILTIKHYGNVRRMEALCARLEVFFFIILFLFIFNVFVDRDIVCEIMDWM